ncbi:3-hydroxybenzoate 6-hydroxylase 1 [Pigmentiphaga humi]|uniref:3-hydroxybenzoate 6-hydroxylase 1 n=1 Tax=Pigmentiphaga humi TaxID=2478468 RepID=A0A3P4B2Q5_9BURK|nr:FAD-dependent monooxygenase [Pigmentiphaga humi]VCU69990.1 3-hydroxybenzoate 6-hydroxylase 1 [Pigmentiphaga humi]
MHSSNPSKPPVLIAGAGIGGLAAALALLRRGLDVEVYEQADQLREVGAGVQISPNGSRVLADLGVLDAVRASSCETEGKEIRLWNTGQTWKLFDLGAEAVRRFGFSYFTAYRVDLHNALVDGVRALKPDAIRLGARCAGFEQDRDGVTLQLESGATARGSALIGADGIHSMTRTRLFGSDRATFADMMAWRAVIPMERVPQHLRRPVGTNWVGPGGHVIHYPLRRGELMNFVGYLERTGWVAESWNVQGTTEECAADFKGWHDDVQALIRAIDAPFKWGIVRRPPLDAWTEGRVTLLGDACHAMFPLLAQGANVAMEDGVVLARCLERDDDVAAALQRYERARHERAYRIVAGSTENINRFHNRALADPVEGPAFIDREWGTSKVQARYDWIFEYDAATVPLDDEASA